MPDRPAGHGGLAALLLLSDGRFPAGGYVHSGGLEPVVSAGVVHDVPSLAAFLRGRARTAGFAGAAFAAAACACCDACPDNLVLLDTEFDARTPAPALRATSRALGRQMHRAARAVRPHPVFRLLAALPPSGPHQAIALGAAAYALGLTPAAAAMAALHESVTGPAAAATRLLAVDPFAVHAVLAEITDELDELAESAARHAATPAAELPAPSAPMLDIAAQHHHARDVRLFAS